MGGASSMTRLLPAALVILLVFPNAVLAQTQVTQNDGSATALQAGAEPWRPLVSRLKAGAIVKMRVQDGSKVGWRVVDISNQGLTIRVRGWMREKGTRTVAFDELTELSQTHPYRNGAITLAALIGALV